MSNKQCSTCGKQKEHEHFHRNKYSPDGLHSKCKECKNEKAKEWYAKAKLGLETGRQNVGETPRGKHLRRTYGISVAQYEELLEKQDHCCAICGKHADEEKRSLAVDHNHVTGEIRGLLCGYCNHRLVGRHRDGDLLRRIADYIEQGTGWFVPKKKRPRKRKKK